MADASKEIYTGAEGSAAGPYAHWATEKTLLSLCDTLKSTGVDSKDIDSLVDMIGTMSKDGKVDTVTLKGVLQNLKQEQTKSKESKKDAEEHAKKEGQFWSNSKKEARRAYQAIKSSDLTDQLGKGAEMMMLPVESISEAFVRVAGIVSSVGGIMAKWGTQIIDNIKILGKWGQGLLKGAIGFAGMIGGLATTIFAGLMGAITGLGNAFFQLYNTGINLAAGLNEGQSGLGALASAAADARLTVGEFAEFVGDNARVAVAIGAAAMGQLSGSVRLALYPLGNLGLTAAETNDYLGDWLETQRSIGVLETMSRAQQAKGAADYLVTLTELAQVTGKQRKQIADSIKANMQQVEVMGLMLGLPDEMKANVQRVGQSLSGILSSIDPEFATGFMEALGKGNLNMTEWGRTLKKAGFQAEANAFQGLIDQTRSGKISEEEAKVKMFAILQQMKENKGATARMNRLFRVNDMTVAGHMKMQAALEGANLQLERQDISMDKQIKTIGSWDEMQKSVSQSWTNFMKGLFNDERFTKTMGTIAESLRKLFAPDSEFTKNLQKFMEGFGPKLVDGMAAFGDWIGDVDFQKYIDKLPGQIKSMGDKIFEFIDMIRGLFFKEVETGDEFGAATGTETTWVAKTGQEIMGDVGGAIGNMMLDVFKAIGRSIKNAALNTFVPDFFRPDTQEVNDLQAALKKADFGTDEYKRLEAELTDAQARQDAERESTTGQKVVLGATAVGGAYVAKKAYNVAKGTANVTGKVVGALTPGAGASTKKVAKEAAERAAREASEKIAKEAAEKAAKEAAEAAGKKAALKVASKVGQRAATIAATSAVGGPFAPLVAVGATIAFAGYDAYRAIEDTANIVGKTEGEAITLGDKIKAGASGVVSGLTFGMVSAKKVHDTVAGWKFWDKEDDMPATPPGIETAHLKALAGVDLSTATAQFKEFSDVIGPLGKGVNSLAVGLIKTEPEKLKLLAEGIAPFEKLDGAKLREVGPGVKAIGDALDDIGWGGLIAGLADPKHLHALGDAFAPWDELDGTKLITVGRGVFFVGNALRSVGIGGMISKLADPKHLEALGYAFAPWAELDGAKLQTVAPGITEINKSLPGLSEVTARLTSPEHLAGLGAAFSTFADIDGPKLSAAAPGMAAINESLPGIMEVTARLTDPVHLAGLAGSFKEFDKIEGTKLTAAAPGIDAIVDALPGIKGWLSGWTSSEHLTALAGSFKEFDKIDGTKLTSAATGIDKTVDALPGLSGVLSKLTDPKHLKGLAVAFKEFDLINGAALSAAAPGVKAIGESLPGIKGWLSGLTDPINLAALGKAFGGFSDIDGTKLTTAAPGVAAIGDALPGIKGWLSGLTEPVHLKALASAFKEFDLINGVTLSAAAPGVKAIGESLPGIKGWLSGLTDPVNLKALAVSFKEFGLIDGTKLTTVAPGISAINDALPGIKELTASLSDPKHLTALGVAFGGFADIEGGKLTTAAPGVKAIGEALPGIKGWLSGLTEPVHLKALAGAFKEFDVIDGTKLTAAAPGIKQIGESLPGIGEVTAKLTDPIQLKALGNAFMSWAGIDGAALSLAAPGVTAINKSLPGIGEVTAKLTDPVHLKALGGAFSSFADVDGAKLTLAAPGIAEINKSLPGIRDVTANLANPEHLTSLARSFSAFANVDGAKLTLAAPGIAEINKSLPGIRDVTANLADPLQLTALAGSFSAFANVDGAKLALAAPGITAINASLPGIRDVVANLANPEQLTALAKSFSTFAEVDGAKLTAAAPGIAEINKSLPGIKEMTAGLTDPVHLKALGGAFKEFEIIDGPKLSAAGPGMKAINDSLPGFGAILSGLTDPKHLKALGVGFSEFGKIDGTNLKLVAPGVAAIGDALEGSLGGALKSLLGADSPIDKLAGLGQIANPVTLAAEALAKLNPQITTLFNSIGSKQFVAGVSAMNTMKNVLGGLDDSVNDWSPAELKQFESITKSMGAYAQATNATPTVGTIESDVNASLKDLVTKMETLITLMQESKTSATENMIKLVSATKQANPFQ